MIPLIVKLKQHTPIIHFLSSQDGATLRATELKPKLDKFLIEKLGGDPPISMKVGSGLEDEPALAYKVRIAQHGRRLPVESENLPMFFGDLGTQEGEEKKALLYDGSAEIQFFAINPNLTQLIRNNIAEFFAKTNFGMRQSKGYGGFYIHPDDEVYREISAEGGYQLSFASNSREWKQAMQQIDDFYKFLRSGINIPRGRNQAYCKSVSFLYAMHRLERQWDKKSIKEAYLDQRYHQRQPDKSLAAQQQAYEDDGESPLHYTENAALPKLLIRDLFGLSSSQSWYYYSANLVKKHNPVQGTPFIDRMKSPLTFKLIKQDNNSFKVYLFADPIPQQVLGERFKVEMDEIKRNSNFHLTFPNSFDWNDFFDFLRTEVNIDDTFKHGMNSTFYKNINHILKQIQD